MLQCNIIQLGNKKTKGIIWIYTSFLVSRTMNRMLETYDGHRKNVLFDIYQILLKTYYMPVLSCDLEIKQ